MLDWLRDYFIRRDLEKWQDDIIRRYKSEGVCKELLEEQVYCNIERAEYGLPVRSFCSEWE